MQHALNQHLRILPLTFKSTGAATHLVQQYTGSSAASAAQQQPARFKVLLPYDGHGAVVCMYAVLSRGFNHDHLFTSNEKELRRISQRFMVYAWRTPSLRNAFVFPVHLATAPRISSQPHPEGEPCTCGHNLRRLWCLTCCVACCDM